MKKLVCLLLAALLTFIFSSASLAGVEASYSDGMLTVSTDEEGFWEITIDTEWIGHWIGSGHPSCTYAVEMAEGEHTALIVNGTRCLTASFWVGEGQAEKGSADQPAAAESTDSVKLDNVSYATGVVRFRASGLRAYAEIWIDGQNTGLTVGENGEQSAVKLLSEGTHTLALYVPAFDEMDVVEFTAADFSPKAEALREVLPALVKNEAGESLGSGLSIDRDQSSFLLRVSVENKPDAVLTFTGEQLRALLEQGLNMIEYVNGTASLYIDLTKVSEAWFDTEAPVTAYCFALIPGEDGARLTVYAVTEAGNAEAAVLSGLTLSSNGRRTAVKQNGVY